ncbi:MAG: hypothetical protein J2O48_02400 [Solirubrobacterales bacterium]|nr:hypothetical protein [Solirubrobacterales bacterium]
MADREQYAERQKAFLDALQLRAPVPEGFDANDLDAAAAALTRKRAAGVRAAWPALCYGLGEEFLPRFRDYVQATPPPCEGDYAADGFAFARSLPRELLTEQAKVELAFARAANGSRLTAVRQGRSILVIAAWGRRRFCLTLGRSQPF